MVISVDVEHVLALAMIGCNANTGKLDWTNLIKEEINRYSTINDNLLNNIELPRDALMCFNMNCSYVPSGAILWQLLIPLISPFVNDKVLNIKLGWNDFVAEQHASARDAFRLWSESGRPRQGSSLEHKKKYQCKITYFLYVIKRNKTTLSWFTCQEAAINIMISGKTSQKWM